MKISKDGGAMSDTAKTAVVASIRAGEVVDTAPPGRAGARVRVVDANPPYLKTDANGTETDNLGGLPTY